MIPLRDSAPRYSFPGVTVGLILASTLLFLYQLSLGAAVERFVFTFGVIPARVALFPTDVNVHFADAFLPFLTSMFMHAGWLHLIGNMWFLWIFGDNIEDRMGHLRYLAFYLLSGLLAGAGHVIFNWGSTAPTVGASGAIAGVLGAYLVLFPRSRVLTLVPWFFFFTVEIPATLMLGYWFLIQLLSGWASAGVGAGGGVAWWAHVIGFAVGFIFARPFARRARQPYYFLDS